MVVDDVGQMVCRQFVGALVEHLVVEYVAHDAHVAADEVIDVNLLTRLDEEAYDILRACGYQRVDLFLRHGQRVAHFESRAGVILEIVDLLAFGLQFLRSVERYVCLAGVKELTDILLVDVAALALAIGTAVAAETDTFVKTDAEPAERLYDVFFGSGHKAVGVCIFDAENQFAAVLTGEEVVVEGGTHTADMQCPGGAGRETHPDFSFGHYLNYGWIIDILCKFTFFFPILLFFRKEFASPPKR